MHHSQLDDLKIDYAPPKTYDSLEYGTLSIPDVQQRKQFVEILYTLMIETADKFMKERATQGVLKMLF